MYAKALSKLFLGDVGLFVELGELIKSVKNISHLIFVKKICTWLMINSTTRATVVFSVPLTLVTLTGLVCLDAMIEEIGFLKFTSCYNKNKKKYIINDVLIIASNAII